MRLSLLMSWMTLRPWSLTFWSLSHVTVPPWQLRSMRMRYITLLVSMLSPIFCSWSKTIIGLISRYPDQRLPSAEWRRRHFGQNVRADWRTAARDEDRLQVIYQRPMSFGARLHQHYASRLHISFFVLRFPVRDRGVYSDCDFTLRTQLIPPLSDRVLLALRRIPSTRPVWLTLMRAPVGSKSTTADYRCFRSSAG